MTHSVLKPSLRNEWRGLLENALPPGMWGVVTDPATYQALGKEVLESLHAVRTSHIAFDAPPKATLDNARTVMHMGTHCCGLIAVGSGTISDLCKYAAYLLSIPYVCIPTAPSMNGYVSATASLEDDGIKSSYPAHAPAAVLCALEVLAAAPRRLILSGIGDSICRATAQADWYFSHLLADTPYDARPFELAAADERMALADPHAVLGGNIRRIEALMRLLLAAGEGMRLAGGSYPASQGEHMIVHTLELLYRHKLPPMFHGELVGIATVTMAALQRRWLQDADTPKIDFAPFPDEEFSRYMNAKELQSCRECYGRKQQLLADKQERLEALWPEWKKALRRINESIQPAEILNDLRAPSSWGFIGLSHAEYMRACKLARFTRERITFLDIV